MGRRSFISMTAVRGLISSYNSWKREQERLDLINSQAGKQKELPPTYSITKFDFNPKTRATKIEFLRSLQYRTVVRYVTQNYVKYPILSDWKVRTKVIKKSIKLTNEELENLNSNSDDIIKNNARDIILALNNEELLPSWFLKELCYNEHEQKTNDLKIKFENYTTARKNEIDSFTMCIKSTQAELPDLNKALDKKNKKLEKINKKIANINNSGKTSAKNILSFGIYASKTRKQKLNTKFSQVNSEILALSNSIKRKKDYITDCKTKTEEAKRNIESEKAKLEKNLKLLAIELDERLSQITSLEYVSITTSPILSPETEEDSTDNSLGGLNPVRADNEIADYPSFEYYLKCFEPIKNEELSYREHPIHGQHLKYFVAIREIYKDRQYPKAMQHVIELCNLDMDLVCKYGTNPVYGDLNFESFKRMVIIYEKDKRFKDCIEICNRAIDVMNKNPQNPFNEYYDYYLNSKLKSIEEKMAKE